MFSGNRSDLHIQGTRIYKNADGRDTVARCFVQEHDAI